VLRKPTSRSLCGLVCPSRTSERGGEGYVFFFTVDIVVFITAVPRGKRLVCERRVARRRGARARRSVRVNPIPNPDPNPNQAPQMSLKEA
jgi:hypothetical protein